MTSPSPGGVVPPGLDSPLRTPEGLPVTVVHLAGEYVPYARTGGLAEAVAGLATFQARTGQPVMTIMPLHRSAAAVARDLVPHGDPIPVDAKHTAQLFRETRPLNPDAPVWFIGHAGYFDRSGLYGEGGEDYPDNPERFAFFAQAALLALPRITRGPLLVHAHDWHTALAFVYLRTRFAGDPFYRRIRTVLSVHNAGYQGYFPPDLMSRLGLPWSLFRMECLEWYGQVNFLKGGLAHADAAVTVSPNHAVELRTESGGFGLHAMFQWMGSRFSGILNGIDQALWDPGNDPLIPARFDRDDPGGKQACKRHLQQRFRLDVQERVPLFGMAARLVTQKGFDLILGHPSILDLPVQYIFLGAGEARYETALRAVAATAPGRISVDTNFQDPLEHELMAGSDGCLMPCQYEPCGLTQMRAQRYGTLPVVRHVGGLADTVEDEVTGFVFRPYGPDPLLGAVLRAMDRFAAPAEWSRLCRNAMHRDFGWERSVRRYRAVYQRVLEGVDRAPEII